MEVIGDSVDVKNLNEDLDRNIEKFQAMLLCEEENLHKLEDQRVRLEGEINTLASEIAEEKLKYREALNSLLSERERLSKKYLEDFEKEFSKEKTEKTPSNSNLLEACEDAIESASNLNLDINIDTEKLKDEVFVQNIKKTSKEEYLKSMREHLSKTSKTA